MKKKSTTRGDKLLTSTGTRSLRKVIRMLHLSVFFLTLSLIVVTAGNSFSQQVKSLTGKVTDSSGTSLPGVSIVVKGTTKGSITDTNGKYTMANVPENATLQFSFVGMKTQEVVVGGKTTINVVLTEETVGIEEVVAIGYGTQKRSTITGAVSTIKSSDLATKPGADMSNLLVGKTAGLIVTNESGQPGFDGSNILIRGRGSNGDNISPLIVVDGVPREFSQLDPNSIESFSILKDAAAVAPYGMAGANGVILVTTKRGKSGAPNVSYNTYYGWQNNAILPKLTNGYENAILLNEINVNTGNDPVYTAEDLQKFKDGSDPLFHQSHNTLKEIFTTNAPISEHNLNVSGGNESVSYFVNLGHLNQDGVLPKTNFMRYNLVANVDIQLTKSTKLSTSINGRVEDRKAPNVGGIIDGAYKFSPQAPLRWPNGLAGVDAAGRSPVGMLNSGTIYKGSNSVIYTQLALEQQLPFIKGLSIKGVFSYDPEFTFNRNWSESTTYYQIDTNTTPYQYIPNVIGANPSFKENFYWTQSFTYQGFINYQNTFGKHDITGLVVLEARNGKYSEFGASRNNYSVLIPELNNGSSSAKDKDNSGYSSQSGQRSSLYRVTYAYASKYLFEASGRLDANYFFAPGHRWGFFPAFSAGWRLSEENFIKNNVSWISNLKIRGSYGESGALAGRPFQYMASYNLYGGAAVFGDNVYQGLYESIEPNPLITWERAKKSNIGFESNIKNGLFTLEADYFFERRTDMLVPPQALVPLEYGVDLAQKNYGKMNNHGIEITSGISVKATKDLTIGLTGNFTYVRNKLIQVSENPATYNNPNRRITGKPLDTKFGYDALGLFQLSDDKNNDGIINSADGYNVDQFGAELHPGDIKYKDVNGDHQMTLDDQVSIGTPYVPEIIYGFGSNITFKGFDLNLLFQGAGHRSIYLQYERAFPFSFGSGMAIKEMTDFWTPENPNAKYPRLVLGAENSGNNAQVSNWWNRDASYLRLKSVTLGYTFSASMLKALKLKTLRLYLSGTNLLTWSPFTSFDPELSQGEGFRYPQQRVISIGANVTF